VFCPAGLLGLVDRLLKPAPAKADPAVQREGAR
jgi:hypothetical protein